MRDTFMEMMNNLKWGATVQFTIPTEEKAMQSSVIGLSLRSNMTQVGVTVYTYAGDESAYCTVNQIDPVE